MDLGWGSDRCVDLHPVTDKRHTAERDARLGHAPRPGIHAEPKHFAGLLGSKPRKIGLVGFPSVGERVVDVGGGGAKRQSREGIAQALCDEDKG